MVMNADLFWLERPDLEQTALEKLAGFFDSNRMDMAMLCVKLEHTTGHNGKKDFNLDSDGRLARYRDGDDNPVVYAGAIAMDSRLLADAPDEPFNLNIYFDRAIAAGRLFGTMLDGEWITVGTPDAIEAAEMTIRRFNREVAA
jgi:MurNAc alpha-1-phosphate uridylyltransferase